VRQALLSAIDRQQIVDTLFKGANPVGNSWLSPRHPLMTDAVKASGTTWPYDAKKAADLFAAAGWTKGPDGILVNAKGEQFTLSIRTITGDKTKEDVEAIVADFWKQAGIKTDIDNQPSQLIYDPAHLFHFGWPSAFLFNYGGNPNVTAEDFRCEDVPTEANQFSGGNLANYCSKEYDGAFAEKDINQTLNVSEREQIAAKLNKIWTNDLPFLPLYFKSETAAVRKGVTGFTTPGTNEGWLATVHTWDISR
jgi:peptide/nickel transport system substrate-binding protein